MHSLIDPASFDHRQTVANGITIHYVEAGTGPLVIPVSYTHLTLPTILRV